MSCPEAEQRSGLQLAGGIAGELKKAVRPVIGPAVARARYRFDIARDRVRPTDINGVPVPPSKLRRLNGSDYLAMGRQIAQALVDDAGLAPDDDVLDIGCGSGRVALALTEILSADGSYQGFDIVPEAVEWCQRRITPKHPNFGFRWADVRSRHYYRPGRTAAEESDFGYDPESFDLAFATSVFTHLSPAATENYLHNTARALRPGGRLYATFFFIDDQARSAIEAGTAKVAFEPSADGSWTDNPRDPEAALAHERDQVEQIITDAGLSLDPVRRGGQWCGRPGVTEYQDVLIATKPAL